MQIVEYSKCEDCGKAYKGKFLLTKEGRITCYDCENPIKVEKLEWKEVDMNEDAYLSELVVDIMKKDIKRIYIPRAEQGKDGTQFMRKDNGEIDLKVMYFQNNPMDLVQETHKYVYIALQYLEAGFTKYEDIANSIIDTYIELREKLFTEKEQEDLWSLIYSEEIFEIVKETEEL